MKYYITQIGLAMRVGRKPSYDICPTLIAEVNDNFPCVLQCVEREVYTYDARGNGDGKTSCTITGGHQSRISDYTAIVLIKEKEGD